MLLYRRLLLFNDSYFTNNNDNVTIIMSNQQWLGEYAEDGDTNLT